MYAAKSFREDRLSVLQEFIVEHSFATVVSQGPQGIEASHVPLIIDRTRGPKGMLRGHFARANPHWQSLADGEVLSIFHGPHAYITPSWYASKREHGRVVPTWDYLAVHAHGVARVFDDAKELRTLIEDLTDQHESNRPAPWKVTDAPDEYIEGAMRAIVGFELTLTRIEGIWKMSQNRPAADRAGVVTGLREGSPMDMQVADWVERLGEGK
ncbi:MAG: FMN-binding negative transcriptional regulator [Acidobacteria bacterium]|nr:FMN-binding negative transcriptional regulator [Acidobacteriota bacterium]MDA1236959.1 FMN-binding negative transcriptional regulator [Acidobacteriota bacterium]